MSPWRRLARSPLVHFLALGALLYGAGRAGGNAAASEARRIVVTAGQIESLALQFARAWKRPPTRLELEGLVAERVREEVYVREARALGLDRDDTIIRRRLRQKFEFLNGDPEATYRDLLARTTVRVEWSPPAGAAVEKGSG